MEAILDRMIARGEERGEERGIVKGEVKYCFEKRKLTPKEISVELDLSEDRVNGIIDELKKENKRKSK